MLDPIRKVYELKLVRTVYTRFTSALEQLTIAHPGDVSKFTNTLQKRLTDKLATGMYQEDAEEEDIPPDAQTFQDILGE